MDPTYSLEHDSSFYEPYVHTPDAGECSDLGLPPPHAPQRERTRMVAPDEESEASRREEQEQVSRQLWAHLGHRPVQTSILDDVAVCDRLSGMGLDTQGLWDHLGTSVNANDNSGIPMSRERETRPAPSRRSATSSRSEPPSSSRNVKSGGHTAKSAARAATACVRVLAAACVRINSGSWHAQHCRQKTSPRGIHMEKSRHAKATARDIRMLAGVRPRPNNNLVKRPRNSSTRPRLNNNGIRRLHSSSRCTLRISIKGPPLEDGINNGSSIRG